jgi:16S rRNA (guanine966-N2)-methyltransferase
MRVIAGRFKGRTLAGPKGAAARPTSDKVREALFSILGPIDEDNVLDLFAGTGALGIEALSRGADHVTFVERDRNMGAIVRTNLQVVTSDEPGIADLRHEDALTFLKRAAGNGAQFDLIFVDPPYADAHKLVHPLAELLPQILAPDGRVIAECDRRMPLILESDTQDGSQPGLALRSERKYGDTLIRILGRSDAGQ